MEIESNNEIVSFTHYLTANNYQVEPVSGGLKRRTFWASKGDDHYVIELGALGTDEMGYGIFKVPNQGALDKRISEVVPISEFNAEKGIKV